MSAALMRAVPEAPAVAPAADDPLVRFVDVQKTYDGETLVVRDLNLAIRRGEFLTLLGPSGSGKTTTLMMLAGFEQPTHGEIFLDGAPIAKLPAHKRGIGMVFQSYALFPHMNVAQNLAFPLEVRGIAKPEIRARVDRALRMVELDGFGTRRPNQLSGGQQQRVAVARALVFEPRLVLMDEPLGALDKQLREQMQYELKQLHETLGVTIVYVTHDQSEALTMSDRIAVFRDGAIEQLATPTELYERPRTPYVAQFIGENNRLNGTADMASSAGRCRVALDNGAMVSAWATGELRAGEQCLLSIRPERIAVGDIAVCDNRFEGRVMDLVYLGDHLRVLLDLGGCTVIAKIPNKSGTSALERGATVAFGWLARDCQAFADRPQAAAIEQPRAPVATDDAAWLPSSPLTNW
jgi:putative spermidine/putrescine transport system ATP-binding protein